MNTENENIWRRDGYHGDNFLGQTLLTRALASLQHLHTLHGPCDGHKCPHAQHEALESLTKAAMNTPFGSGDLLEPLLASRKALQLANQEQP